MATSHVTIHGENISARLHASPFGGTAFGARRGFGHGDARALAARMVLQARINAATRFHQRSTALVSSVVPIVREFPGGASVVGVGTTVEHGKWLEVGTDPHFIPPGRVVDKYGRPYLKSRPDHPEDMNPFEKRVYKTVPHPGNEARHWLSDAVRAVLPGAHVTVREHK